MTTSIDSTPAYLVYHNDHVNPSVEQLFFDTNLSAARRSAITLAESLVKEHTVLVDHGGTEVYLVEMDPNIESPLNRIARILKSSVPTDEEFEETTEEAKHSNQQYCAESLMALKKEHAYYVDNGIHLGFGSFDFKARLEGQDKPKTTISVLFDAAGYALALIGRYKWQAGHEFTVDYKPTAPELTEPLTV